MLEDATTRSWWRQANGEAIAGARKGAARACAAPLGRAGAEAVAVSEAGKCVES